jgi:hypothetical protein
MEVDMKYLFTRFKWIVILILIELFFYFRIKPSKLERCFMVWGVIAMALLFSNIFKVNEDNPMPGLGGDDSSNYANLATAFVERKYGSEKNIRRSNSGLFDPINLGYLLLLLANIIGYAIILD